MTTARFRYHSALTVAAVIATISAVPLTAAGWYFALVALVPLAIAIWAWRAGTDADAGGLRVRALLGERRLSWTQVEALVPERRGRVVAVLSGGARVPLPAVTARDLPRLVAASGRQISARD